MTDWEEGVHGFAPLCNQQMPGEGAHCGLLRDHTGWHQELDNVGAVRARWPNAASSTLVEFRSYASEADWDARCMAAEQALRAAMVLLADADDAYQENLLDALFDCDDGFALDFYNRVVAGENDAEVIASAPVVSGAEVKLVKAKGISTVRCAGSGERGAKVDAATGAVFCPSCNGLFAAPAMRLPEHRAESEPGASHQQIGLREQDARDAGLYP